MTIALYFHPFASYCQKALIAFREKGVPFEPHVVDLGDERSRAEFYALWPLGRFPVIRESETGQTFAESTVIVEYVDRISASAPLIPADPDEALKVRQWDRVLDNYVHNPMQKIVGDRLRPEGARNPHGVEEARATIEKSLAFIETKLGEHEWLAGPNFSLADCAAAPPLFYLEKILGFGARYPGLGAYFGRLMNRPSFSHVVEEARNYRHFFPSAPNDGDWPER